MILETGFEMVWWRGRKWNHIKKDFWSWSVFLLSKYWLPLLFEETLGALFLHFPFSFSFPFFFSMLCLLRTLGVLMIFKEKITSSKTSFQMAWHGMAWSWLWIYWRWTHIPEWSYACQYYWVKRAKKFRWQIIFENFQNSQWTHPLIKLNIKKSCYVDGIWL